MPCRPCQKRRLPGNTKNRPLLLGDANGEVTQVKLIGGDYWNFDNGDVIWVTGTGVQQHIDNEVIQVV